MMNYFSSKIVFLIKKGGGNYEKNIYLFNPYNLYFATHYGVYKRSIGNSKNENQTIETTANKSENDIREVAYQSLNEHNKKTVISWKEKNFEQYKYTKPFNRKSEWKSKYKR